MTKPASTGAGMRAWSPASGRDLANQRQRRVGRVGVVVSTPWGEIITRS